MLKIETLMIIRAHLRRTGTLVVGQALSVTALSVGAEGRGVKVAADRKSLSTVLVGFHYYLLFAHL